MDQMTFTKMISAYESPTHYTYVYLDLLVRIGLVLEVQIFRGFCSLLGMNRLTRFHRLKWILREMILKIFV